jgi:nitroreductase
MMSELSANPRVPETQVDSMFLDRWSPRAFLDEPIPDHQVKTLFEAARWAPSCFNEQPWLFLYATELKKRKIFTSLLVEKNQRWAASAPLLIFVVARRKFIKGGADNRHAKFDAGAAWMSLALQARKLGLYAHAMAGFHLEKSYQVLGVPKEDYEVIAAVAVGRLGDSSRLPDDLLEMELPKDRKAPAEVASDKIPFVE